MSISPTKPFAALNQGPAYLPQLPLRLSPQSPSKMEALPNRIETPEVSQMNQIQKKGKNKIAPEFQCPIPMESLQKKKQVALVGGQVWRSQFLICNEL